MKMIRLLLACACAFGFTAPAEAAGMLGGGMPAPQPQAPSAPEDPVLEPVTSRQRNTANP